MITERDAAILRALVHYYILNRVQIQRLCFPGDGEGRITRRRLQSLVAERYIGRTQVQVFHPGAGAPAPVYFPATRGCEFLADYTGDESVRLAPTQTPQHHHLFHWLAVSDTHIALDRALAGREDVSCEGWLSEWDVANKDESAPDRRYRIYTLIHESPRLVCAPDAAFLLSARGHRKVFYVEQDRATSGVNQIAASKTPGYAAMAERGLHRRHFPQTTLDAFTVLLVAPGERRRDALRRAIAGKPGSHLWRFVAQGDLAPERFFSEPVFHPCEGDPAPLVKPATAGSVA